MPVTDQDANDITKGGGATAIVNVTTMPHIDALQTDEQGTDLPSLLGKVEAILARQNPEQLEEIWKNLLEIWRKEEHPISSAESEDPESEDV